MHCGKCCNCSQLSRCSGEIRSNYNLFSATFQGVFAFHCSLLDAINCIVLLTSHKELWKAKPAMTSFKACSRYFKGFHFSNLYDMNSFQVLLLSRSLLTCINSYCLVAITGIVRSDVAWFSLNMLFFAACWRSGNCGCMCSVADALVLINTQRSAQWRWTDWRFILQGSFCGLCFSFSYWSKRCTVKV